LGEINATLGEINATLGEINATLGEINVTLGEINATLGEIKATLGDKHIYILKVKRLKEENILLREGKTCLMNGGRMPSCYHRSERTGGRVIFPFCNVSPERFEGKVRFSVFFT
jgi:hypothetical protein